jgi:hypothetical protein
MKIENYYLYILILINEPWTLLAPTKVSSRARTIVSRAKTAFTTTTVLCVRWQIRIRVATPRVVTRTQLRAVIVRRHNQCKRSQTRPSLSAKSAQIGIGSTVQPATKLCSRCVTHPAVILLCLTAAASVKTSA